MKDTDTDREREKASMCSVCRFTPHRAMTAELGRSQAWSFFPVSPVGEGPKDHLAILPQVH